MKKSNPREGTKFGTLTTTSAPYSVDKRRYVDVRCKCGTTRAVLLYSLTTGATRSCGVGPCRRRLPKTKVDRAYRPGRPRSTTPATVKRAWNRYHRPGNGESMAVVAARFNMAAPTMLSLFRSIEKCGGIDRYMELVRGA